MFKLTASPEWLKKASEAEEGCDISAGQFMTPMVDTETPTIRVMNNYLWHLYARKNEKPAWHFMGSTYHKGNADIVREELARSV